MILDCTDTVKEFTWFPYAVTVTSAELRPTGIEIEVLGKLMCTLPPDGTGLLI
jgi:hypothetical protein